MLGVLQGHDDLSVGLRRRGEHGKFQSVIRRSQIAARRYSDMLERFGRKFYVVGAEPLALIVKGLQKRVANIFGREMVKLEHAATRHDSGRHGSVRVFCRRTDKDDCTLFDRGKQAVRLRFVKAVALVQQKIRSAVIEF